MHRPIISLWCAQFCLNSSGWNLEEISVIPYSWWATFHFRYMVISLLYPLPEYKVAVRWIGIFGWTTFNSIWSRTRLFGVVLLKTRPRIALRWNSLILTNLLRRSLLNALLKLSDTLLLFDLGAYNCNRLIGNGSLINRVSLLQKVVLIVSLIDLLLALNKHLFCSWGVIEEPLWVLSIFRGSLIVALRTLISFGLQFVN